MFYLFLLLMGLACLIALYNWRWGVFAAIAIALLQDPVRKMIPGTPGLLSMASVPVWIAVIGHVLLAKVVSLNAFIKQFPQIGMRLKWFGVYLMIPVVLSASYGRNSWMITLLGAVIYGTILMMFMSGWRFPVRQQDVSRLLMFYAVLASLMLLGGPLEFFGWNRRFAAIGTEVFDHIWVTHRTGGAVYMIAGFFRSPDVMGWHASMVFMVSVLMAIHTRGKMRIFWIALAVWGASNIWLCGRRKMVAMIPIFIGVYLLLIYRFTTVRRIVPIAATVLLIAGIGWHFISTYFYSDHVETFYISAFHEAGGQLQRHAFAQLFETVRQSGFLGYGLGMGQQGVHHVPAEMPRLWQESGPTKLVAELGVPGAILFVWLLIGIGLTAYHVLQNSARSPVFYQNAGFASILIANAASSLVSAQIYGDPFVGAFLALTLGILFSSIRTMREQDAMRGAYI